MVISCGVFGSYIIIECPISLKIDPLSNVPFMACMAAVHARTSTCSLPIAANLFNYKTPRLNKHACLLNSTNKTHNRRPSPSSPAPPPRTSQTIILSSQPTQKRPKAASHPQHVHSLRPHPPFMRPPSKRHSRALKQHMDLRQPYDVPRAAATG